MEFEEEIDYYKKFLDDKNVTAKVKRMCNSEFCDWKSVIENPYFQRLKGIKQLGHCSAALRIKPHTRYEHSRGTFLFAAIFMATIERNMSVSEVDEYNIPDDLKKCVLYAALLHDIGHGPYSHFFDQQMTNDIKHEEVSLKIIELKFNKIISPSFNNDMYIKLIQYLIDNSISYSEIKPLMDNFGNYKFIFEIVSNRFNGIDVDKFDYLKRDLKHFEKKEYEDYFTKELIELLNGVKVSKDGLHVIYNKKDFKNIQLIFKTREYLHENLYQEKRKLFMERKLLNGILKNQNVDNSLKIIYDCIKKKNWNGLLKNYVEFDDKFIEQFYLDGNEDVKKVYAIINYPCVTMRKNDLKFIFYDDEGKEGTLSGIDCFCPDELKGHGLSKKRRIEYISN